MWDVCVMKCSCVNMAVKGYKNHFKKHVERYLLLFLFNTCRCNINLHFFAKLTSLTLVLHCIHVKELVECSAFSSSRKIPRLSGGQEAVVNKSESGWVSIFISERRERERVRWKTTYSTESSASRFVLGNVQLGSQTAIQPVGGCKNVRDRRHRDKL